jgi:hypothetical protein
MNFTFLVCFSFFKSVAERAALFFTFLMRCFLPFPLNYFPLFLFFFTFLFSVLLLYAETTPLKTREK